MAFTALIAALVAACGSSTKTGVATTTAKPSASAAPTSADAGGGPKDACSLLTGAEIQAAFGGTVNSGTLTTAPGVTQTVCNWTITPATGDAFGAELDVYPASAESDFTQRRQSANGPTADVAGVGDKAYSERAGGGSMIFDDLWVRKGTTTFRIEVLKDLGTKPLVPLAQSVITRL